ncbi:BREX-1 system phosphatase PglZ type A [Lutibacter sp. HS1-25]|uniref:BREX-1 system phosphatase PglZ type A n=1 Tax=Lutibacter sp. HS1-25 TaxID=2485000 RepID=UPI001013202D|nr:BREX-1 system phosphatase PglZ type A [Lutibacter sp. HS1-25]RXP53132.1 BREX-1 system phosphatase PglZ type A [Lutibacter sp. HS1-25]
MLKEKVESYFTRFPKLKILFFFDESSEYLEEVQNLQLTNIHTEYWMNNPFSLKNKLLNQLQHTKVLLYIPMAHPNTQEAYHNFPLMGLYLANKELQLDNVGAFLEDYGLQRHQKTLVAKYIKELKYAGVQEVCKPILNAANFKEPALQKALVASFLKFKTIESWQVLIAKMLTLTIHTDANELQKVSNKIKNLNFEDEVLKHIKDCTGYAIQNISEANLLQVARSVLYNKLTQTINSVKGNDPYKGFKITDTTALTRLNQMLYEIDRHPALKSGFKELLQKVSNEIKGATLIEVYGEDANFAEFNTEMIWTLISKVQAHMAISPTEIIKKLEMVSLQSDVQPAVAYMLKYGIQVAKMQELISKVKTYILDTPEEYVQQYTEKWYKVDACYRKAIALYKKLDIPEIPEIINIDELHAALNATYEKHTDTLNREWLKCLNQFQFNYPKINVPKQYDFYETEIAPVDQKVVVIISDALRYEAAHELLSEMHGDSKNTAEMRYMLASIPSKTNVGMAQLLPGKNKIFNGGDIKSDDISTSGTENRSKILQKFKEKSKAIQYGDLDGIDRPKIRDIFKNDVVYVYHDVIDATGDKKPSERRAFGAVEDAIKELQTFVKLLHASYNVAKVFITADHGFLYNDREIEEKDKENLPTIDVIQSHNRYYLTLDKTMPELGYSIPLAATTTFKDDIYVTVPFSVNRFKKQGVGHQFVHCGGSLQEVVIPLIESSRKLKEVTRKVTPIIINKGNLKVVSNILKLNILQEHEVSRTEKERTISVGLYNDATLVSNEEHILLNFTSESPSERMARVELLLASEAATEPFLKLKIVDIEDKLNPLIEERIQNNTLIQTDF